MEEKKSEFKYRKIDAILKSPSGRLFGVETFKRGNLVKGNCKRGNLVRLKTLQERKECPPRFFLP
jgi:hypothetical protein